MWELLQGFSYLLDAFFTVHVPNVNYLDQQQIPVYRYTLFYPLFQLCIANSQLKAVCGALPTSASNFKYIYNIFKYTYNMYVKYICCII